MLLSDWLTVLLHFLISNCPFRSAYGSERVRSCCFHGLNLFIHFGDVLHSFSFNDVINNFDWIVVKGGEYFP